MTAKNQRLSDLIAYINKDCANLELKYRYGFTHVIGGSKCVYIKDKDSCELIETINACSYPELVSMIEGIQTALSFQVRFNNKN